MAFPDIPLDVRAELLLAGTWTDVSAYLDHGPVSTGRGHPDESVTVAPSTLALTLTNTDARFSSKNPTSPYYPNLVRNTPSRVSIPSDQPYLRLESDQVSYASCPAVSVTTDLDVRADVLLTDWRQVDIAGSWQVGGARGWGLTIDAGGYPRLYWSTTGSDSPSARATAMLPRGRITLRATLQLSTGNVTYYTAPGGSADGSSWTQLGQVVNTSGATSLHAPAMPVTAGNLTSDTAGMYGRLYELEVRSGIGGTVVAHPVFSSQAAGTTTFTDAQGNAWTLSGTSELSARDYRLHAEVPEWPQHQDPTGKTWTVSAAGGGLLRRLSQRNSAINSAMWRAWVKTGASLAAYHPMEDGIGAQSLASGIGGPAAAFSGPLQLASNSSFASSAPLPVLNGTVVTGKVPAYAPGWNGNQVSWLMQVPSGGESNGAEVMRFSTTGTIAQVVVTYGTGGSMAPAFYSASGTLLGGGGPVAFAVNGQALLCWVSLAPDGSGGINWEIATVLPNATTASAATGNIASASVSAVTAWTLNGGGQLLQTAAGHVAVQAVSGDLTPLGGPLNAWQGEAAGNRFSRLCSEEGIPFRAGGDLGNTVLMGVQSQQTLPQLLQECAAADRGVWYELRQQLGWGYVPRAALYNQPAAVAVTYAQDMLGEWAADPTEDDKDIRNDETVTQTTGGGSARQVAAPGQAITGGRLAALSPPSGSGTYDGSDSLNVWHVSDLPSLAAWIAHVGTVDEPRYPGIVLDLSNRNLASVFYQILALELGQRLTIASPPAQLGPDTISQLAWQLTEEIWGDTLKITMAGAPSRPYLVAQEGASTGRLDTDGSALAAAVTSGATTLQVMTTGPSGILWTTSGGDVPFDVAIGGERVTVTAIAAVTATSLGTDDGTFESGVSRWTPTGGTLAQSSAHAHTGTFSALLTVSGSPSLAFFRPLDMVPVIPGVTYTASLWLYGASVANCSAAIDWFTAGGGYISTTGGTPGTATTTWTQFTAAGAAPAGAAFAAYGPTITGSPANGTQLWTDDVLFTTPAQQFTVTRSVNGVVKAQAAGTAVALWDTPVAAL